MSELKDQITSELTAAEQAVLAREYPFATKELVLSDSSKINYIDEGNEDGRDTLLMIHGNPTWSFYYRNLVKSFRETHRVIVPDLVGMGFSSRQERAFSATERVEHLQEFIDKLSLKHFSLVMHDWGGSLGAALAVDNLDRVNKLVFLNTTLTITECLPRIIRNAASPLIGKFLTQRSRHFLNLTTTLGAAKKLNKTVKKCFYLPYKTKARRQAIWDFVADIPFDSRHRSYNSMMELANKIPTLQGKPVQIIWGLKDPCFHREMLNNVAALFPQADVLELPEASHLVLEDEPEKVQKQIRSFLETQTDQQLQSSVNTEAAAPLSNKNPLLEGLLQISELYPYSSAVIEPNFLTGELKYSLINYRDFKKKLYQYANGLNRLGLEKDDKVVFLVKPGIDFLALSYAVMWLGAVPVFLDPGMGKDKLLDCIKAVKPKAFFGTHKAQLLRLFKKQAFESVDFSITVGSFAIPGSHSIKFLQRFTDRFLKPAQNPGDIALIAYTSGATGAPKGVTFDYRMLAAQKLIFSEQFGLQANKKDLPLLPIFSLYNLSIGVCSVFAPINPAKPLSLDPRKIIQIINNLNVTYSFGSPTLWKKIAEYSLRSHQRINSLEKIFMAGAPVPAETITLLKNISEDTTVYTPYGATECLPVTLISGDEILSSSPEKATGGEQGTFVGAAINGVNLLLIDQHAGNTLTKADLQPLESYVIGELLVQGDNISPAYFQAPEQNQQNKIEDGDRFWHRIGDLGYLDDSGKLYFCGRKVHSFSSGDLTYYSVPTEKVFNQHSAVSRSALVKLNSGQPAVVIEATPEIIDNSAAQQILADELFALAAAGDSPLPAAKSIERIYFKAEFPVDGRHNAKIFRDQLGLWASEQPQKEYNRVET